MQWHKHKVQTLCRMQMVFPISKQNFFSTRIDGSRLILHRQLIRQFLVSLNTLLGHYSQERHLNNLLVLMPSLGRSYKLEISLR